VRSLLGIQGPQQGMPGAERHEWSDTSHMVVNGIESYPLVS
jgi:hypothetical protein